MSKRTWELVLSIAFICIQVVGVLGCLGCCGLFLTSILAVRLLERLEDYPIDPAPSSDWPQVSIIVPACNEELTIEDATTSLLRLDYPNLEIILINDRSTDKTGFLIDTLAAKDKRVHASHIEQLPDGWLGKVHAMHCGTQIATGSLLLFTDADVHFNELSLKRAVTRMQSDNLSHLAILPKLVPHKLGYNIALSAFAILFLAGIRAWKFRLKGTNAYAGVGAFALVRRKTFEQTSGWQWLRMEIADDVGLGMLIVREAQGKSNLLIGTDSLHVDWYDGLGSMIRGLEKNLFGATCDYSWMKAIAVTLGFLTISLGPLLLGICYPFTESIFSTWVLVLLVVTWILQLLVARLFATIELSFFASLLAPLGFSLLAYIVVRSTFNTLLQGGVRWRDKFYSIEELRSGKRVDL